MLTQRADQRRSHFPSCNLQLYTKSNNHHHNECCSVFSTSVKNLTSSVWQSAINSADAIGFKEVSGALRDFTEHTHKLLSTRLFYPTGPPPPWDLNPTQQAAPLTVFIKGSLRSPYFFFNMIKGMELKCQEAQTQCWLGTSLKANPAWFRCQSCTMLNCSFFIPLPSVLLLLIVQSQERTEPFEIKSNRGLVRLNQRLNQATVCPNCWCAHAENFSGESLGSDNSIFIPWRVALAKDTASTTGPQQSKRSKKAGCMSRRWQVMLLQ